ncbi:acyl-CoA thioester hydrolase [Aquisalimonas asiatica]|uniref:Acyl-CoA thioester hydrolase n=1 Tax=Aquisalimonas asiatica TaxID=406100 RepID=A0A1H8U1P9_9GAMM|nr:acyl-CoA thioester hydrolase [Aquisalimonas asiatica]
MNVTKFRWPIRVYYEDTDAGGVVYHANYLKFFERARTEWLRALGFEQDRLRDEHGLVFVVHDMNLRFHQPARFNDQLVVTCDVRQARGASMTFHQEILAADQDTRLCDAGLTVACIDNRAFRPRPIPKMIRAEMQHAR